MVGEVAVAVLGPWQVRIGGEPRQLPNGRCRVLFASLLLAVNRPVPLDTLADQVWTDRPPARRYGALHTYVFRIRQALGADLIQTDPGGYLLTAAPEDIDLYRFRALRDQAARAESADEELGLLRSGLALWRGRPFGDLTSTWLDREVVPVLTEEWFAATERRIDLELATSPASNLVAELAELTQRYPTRESLWIRLIGALHRAGRRAEALDRYEQVRISLRDELGIDPSEELARLHRAVLLDGSPGSPAAPDPPDPSCAEPSAPGPVRQLPHDIRNFVGREAELATLESFASRPATGQPTTIVAIDGAPGTGKTTLAIHGAHRVADRFPDTQLYLNLRGYGPGEPVQAADAAAALLRAMDVASDRIPAGVDERSALLRSTLADRPALLVLDNARDAEQVRPLLPGRGSLVIVTSRNQLRSLAIRDRAHRLTLRPMAPDQAVDLIATTIGADRVAAEPAATRDLVQLCDRLPLALAIVAERAQRADSLADVVSALGDARARLDGLGAGDPQSDLQAALSWSYLALPAPAAAMFRKLGLHPANDICLPAAAALADLTPDRARTVLDQLVAGHLVEQRQPDRYEMHDLIRLYAIDLADRDEPEPERAATIRRVFDWYLHAALSADSRLHPHRRRDFAEPLQPQQPPPDFGTVPAAVTFFEREYDCLREVISWASEHGHPGHAWRIALAMATFLDTRIPWSDGQACFEQASRAAAADGDPVGQGFTLNAVGCIHIDREDWQRAEGHLLEALRHLEQAGHRRGTAMVLGNVGIVTAHLGNHELAVQYCGRAIQLYEQEGYQRGIAINLDSLGTALSRIGKYREAIVCHLRAARINTADPTSDGYNQQNLGRAYAAQGDHRAAVGAFRRSVAAFRAIDNRRWEASALTDLGQLLADANHPGLSRSVLRAALAILTDLADPRATEVAAMLS